LAPAALHWIVLAVWQLATYMGSAGFMLGSTRMFLLDARCTAPTCYYRAVTCVVVDVNRSALAVIVGCNGGC
jgi:hypothetical protein